MDTASVESNSERNMRARQYYHRRIATDPMFREYTNARNRNLIHKKKLEADAPKKKIGRPKKVIPEQTEETPRIRVGRPLKYPNENYILEK